ncbi:MAG: bifunctional folylpolyglutamate synthase/dihydrofolate synthase, partial [Bauldia sp.]|nr:bifunctional folylpolyglutamate synthase/dihydrofolate synthase [Bauldia sp.]
MDRSSAILERLLHLHPREIDLSLERVERLMADLDHPERRLPPVIHVAGTNGKGSTTAFMRAMLESAGKRVHVYTSPHLVRFHERIRLGDRNGSKFVDEDELADALINAEKVNDRRSITQFEIATAAAFDIFTRHPADVLLLEVGLGGRLDATNVVAEPLATVITAVSHDHEKHLGETITAIAREKAGILKRRRPGIVAPQTDEALIEIENQAARVGAELFVANRDWVAYPEAGRLVYQDEDGLIDLPAPRLLGRHQFTNAGTAIATMRRAGFALPQAAVEAGLLSVYWPARLQSLSGGAIAARLPEAEIWLDGGHNPAAGVVIAEAMADLEERSPKPLILIGGMLNTKDPVGFFRPFAGLARKVYAVPVPGSNAGREPGELAAAARDAGLTAEAASDIAEALGRIAAEKSDKP